MFATATPLFAQEKIERIEKAEPWPDTLSTLESIPSFDSIAQVVLIASSNGGKLDEQGFKTLMNTAKPLDANDPIVNHWHYAPWYNGSFVVKEETYRFALYLGGMGVLLTPEKEKGMFRFEYKAESKE